MKIWRAKYWKRYQPLLTLPTRRKATDHCKSFQDAISRLEVQRYDILILDLKDSSQEESEEDENPAGVKVFDALKRTRFTPVVFYTALAHKVRSEQTSFVRVVEKTQGISRVREEVKAVIATKLPTLFRRVEEIQRDYLWDFVGTHWQEFDSPHDQADLAYLLARRLALTLQSEARKLTRKLAGKSIPIADPKNIHPMEMYVRPPVNENRQAGDILKGIIEGESGYWLILTPSCDFEQAGRLKNVLLAGCLPLAEEAEFQSWKQNPNASSSLKALIGDNRERSQSERFKFLPATYFLPDLVLDFQHLKALPESEIAKLEVIASLDSPYAESVLARFARYFGRLGTPDIDKQIVLNRLHAAQAQNSTQTNTGKDELSGKE